MVPQSFAALGPLVSYSTSGRSLILVSQSGQRMRITPYGDRMMRVQAAPAGAAFVADTNYEFVERHDWPGTLVVADQGSYLSVSTQAAGAIEVRITKSSLHAVFYRDGQLILAEDSARGITAATPTTVNFVMHADEHFAGLGHGKFGRVDKLDLRDQVIVRGSDTQSSLIVPFYLSTGASGRGYGVFANSPWKNQFSFKPSNYQIQLMGGQMDYFFIDGPSFAEVLDRYTELLGRPRLMPISALGLMMSDKDRGAAGPAPDAGNEWWKHTLAKMRAGGWPLEVFVHDNTWRGGKIANWDWDVKHYPSPADFAAWSKGQGTVSMLDFNRGDTELSDGWRQEFALPGTKSYPDFTNPEARRWFWNLLYSKAFNPDLKYPSDMLWMDEFDMNPSVRGRLANGKTWDEEQNHYFFLRDKTVGEGWLADLRGEKRPFLMNRGMFAGSARFGATLWTGDINASYGEMKNQIRGMLQAGLSGVPYWGQDQGGFKSQPSDDLYRQWSLAQGALSPIWKPHGLSQRYPWQFSAAAQTNMREYGALRSRLVPYLYTYAARSSQTGAPMARPMIFDYQNDTRAWAADQQYLLGHELLVAPATRSDAGPINVWLPAGNWIDYWTDAPIAGNRTVARQVDLGVIPMYVRAGAIIPQQVAASFTTAAMDRASLALHVYAGADGSFSLYEDDGVTERYRQGESRTTELRWSQSTASLAVDAAQGGFTGAQSTRRYEVVVHAATAPSRVILNGQELPQADSRVTALRQNGGWVWDAARKTSIVYSPSVAVANRLEVQLIGLLKR